jgi:hypothetical protein
MLSRVAENLYFLLPSSETSIPLPARSSLSATAAAHGDGSVDIPTDRGLFYFIRPITSGKVMLHHEFDKYYSQVVSMILSIIFDTDLRSSSKSSASSALPTGGNGGSTSRLSDNSSNTNFAPFLPLIPDLGAEIRNIHAVKLVKLLLKSGFPSLVIVACRVVFAIMRSNPNCVVILKVYGVVDALMECLRCICLLGSLTDDQPLTAVQLASTTTKPKSHKSFTGAASPNSGISLKELACVAQDILLVLEMVAVATAYSDNAVLAQIVALCMNTSLAGAGELRATSKAEETGNMSPAASMQSPMMSGSSGSSSLGGSRFFRDEFSVGSSSSLAAKGFRRCHNCESEVAVLECLNESCIREKCFQLCQECDKVFHKAAVKRVHIRVHALKTFHDPESSSYNMPSASSSPGATPIQLLQQQHANCLQRASMAGGFYANIKDAETLLNSSLWFNESRCESKHSEDCGGANISGIGENIAYNSIYAKPDASLAIINTLARRSVFEADLNGMDVCGNSSRDILLFKEIIIGMLVACVRGLLDDRKVLRYVFIPAP